MSAFARKVAAEQTDSARQRARNPRSPEQLLRWLRRHAPPVVGKLVESNADLRRMFGPEARIELHAHGYALPGCSRWGGYEPSGPYLDLSVSLDGGRTGVGRSLFLEVADNALHSPRFGWRWDADAPLCGESLAFLDKIESEIARMLRGERPAKMVH